MLGQFDCRQQYSLHTCEDCKVAYRDWVCAVQFRKCKVDECAGCTEKVCVGEILNASDCDVDMFVVV